MKLEEAEGNAKVQFVKAGEEQTTPTKEVDELVAQAQLLQAQNQAEAAAKRGDFGAAALCFSDASHDFAARGHVGVAAATGRLGMNYHTPGVYAQSGGSRMAMNKGLNRARAASAMAAEDHGMLRSLNIVETRGSRGAN